MSPTLAWMHAKPHIIDWQIGTDVIDHYGHVNNVAYVAQIEKVAWSHSNALGLTIEQYQDIDRGMAIKHHEIDYLLPCHTGQTLACATWIIDCDQRLMLTRQFQFICRERLKTVFTAKTQFVCIALSSGIPKRMPDIFKRTYGGAQIAVSAQE